MNKTAQAIYDECSSDCRLMAIEGKTDIEIRDLAPFENCGTGDLIFIDDEKIISHALSKKPSAIVVSAKNAEKIEDKSSLAVLISDNVGVAHALIKQKYKDQDFTATGWERIHRTAVIHESVEISDDTIIGPHVSIEKGVKLGKGSVIMANVVIQHGASIGDRCVIYPSSVVCYDCIIGDDCIILSNSVIGAEGMGFSQDENFNHYRIPQTGIVRLGDRVVIGAANTIDRATYEETKIGNGTIFDNICHTAHNVEIGENCIILPGWLCAGSSKIGDRVIASGQTMLKDHVNVASDTVFVHRAGVIRDITEKGMYAGLPTQPMKQYTKNLSAYNTLGELKKQIKELEKKVAELEKSSLVHHG